MAAELLEAAPAKINLALHVTARRSDGYHELESLVVFADVSDELDAVAAPADHLRISGPFAAGLHDGDGNLVRRAVAAFRARWPGAVATGVAMHLRKNLPVSAGLGGGSADAAAALRLMVDLSTIDIPTPELMLLAASLGADVPVCLASRPALISGVGERVRLLPECPPLHIVLVNPLVAVPTADVFRRLTEHQNPPLPALPEGLDRASMLALWLVETRNDLEAPAIAIAPVIAELIAGMAGVSGCTLARMSGSGATVFGLFGSSTQAHQAAHDLRRKWPAYWIAAAPLLGV
jgi:4-diphosphocytidyl-2-C-methyl-D-erythritol kinase